MPSSVIGDGITAIEHAKYYELGLCLGSGRPTLDQEPDFSRVTFVIAPVNRKPT